MFAQRGPATNGMRHPGYHAGPMLMLTTTVFTALGIAMTDPPTPDTARTPNALADETSPYLLQHAYNPVQWYPWGSEAIEKARIEGKPIFLSVGYSTCYWCHVMERESFENEDIAALLNEYFVPVKVDREERPDVDDVYMTAVQLMTGRGGWPMSVFIEPIELKPFFGGTYFPPEDRGGRPGFGTLLEGIHGAWIDPEKRVQLEDQAQRLADAVRNRLASAPAPVMPDAGVVDAGVAQLMASYDARDAGFGGAPKFPSPPNLELLMAAAWDRPDVQAALTHTLDRMAMGGMYDQVGGGFHRYSTDAKWLVPHFEKMLYDNGQLASLYAEAGERTGDGFYSTIAAEISDYVLRDMLDDTGAFWSAQDAESNAREGETYIWTPNEVDAALTAAGLEENDIVFAHRVYALDEPANFRDPHHSSDPRWVLHLVDHPSVLAQREGLTAPAFHQRLVRINAALKQVRDARDQPTTDDKVLAGWNGLMIGGLADTGRLLSKVSYVQAAATAAEAIRSRMWSKDGGLLRTMRGGEARIPAFLEDYALLTQGVLSLYEATEDAQWLIWAEQLVEQAKARFWSPAKGWFDMPENDEHLFVRGRSLYDGALPSGTSTMLGDLVELYELTGKPQWGELATATARSIGTVLQRSPRGMPIAVAAVYRRQQLSKPDSTEPGAPAPDALTFSGGSVKATVRGLPASLAQGEAAMVQLTLAIETSWHLTLPISADEFAMPLSIDPGDGTVEVTVQWPAGHPFKTTSGTIQVVDGTLDIPVTLKRTAQGDGPVSIIVTWQACDDQVCIPPVTHRFGPAS